MTILRKSARILALSLALSLGAFTPALANGDGTPLAGSAWLWDEAPNNPADGVGPVAQVAEIAFGDGGVEVHLGCNLATGSYTSGPGDALDFALAGKTKMMCADMMYEERFFALLERVAKAVIDGPALVLFDETGAQLARLVRK